MTANPTSAHWLSTCAFAVLACLGNAAQAVDFGTGYSESFDSMGVLGTAAPAGWRVFVGPSGTSNSTWTNATGIPGAGVAAMVASTAGLTAVTTPSATNNNGYNAAASASATADRVLATSPTTVSGSALQLTLSNNTSAAIAGLAVSFDTVRFTSAGTANELPGYALFYSLDGANWSNVAALNPTLVTVPNSIGVTSTSDSFTFSSPWAAGTDLLLRWVDDNATQTSPDQIIGLNNLRISAVPEPAAAGLMLAGLAAVVAFAKRRRTAATA